MKALAPDCANLADGGGGFDDSHLASTVLEPGESKYLEESQELDAGSSAWSDSLLAGSGDISTLIAELSDPYHPWDHEKWLATRQILASRGRVSELPSLLNLVRETSSRALRAQSYKTSSGKTVDLSANMASVRWFGWKNARVPPVHGATDKIEPPLVITDMDPLDVVCELQARGQLDREICVAFELRDFTPNGELDLSSGRTASVAKQRHSWRTDFARYAAPAARWCRDSRCSLSQHMCAVQDPYVFVAPDVTLFRGGHDEGYPFLESPVQVQGIAYAMPTNRPNIIVAPKLYTGEKSFWYANDAEQSALLERMNLVAYTALQDEDEPKRILVLSAAGCMDGGMHPRDAVASALKHWRTRFARLFHTVILACGPNEELAQFFDVSINRPIYTALLGEDVSNFADWHWKQEILDLHINRIDFTVIAELYHERRRGSKASAVSDVPATVVVVEEGPGSSSAAPPQAPGKKPEAASQAAEMEMLTAAMAEAKSRGGQESRLEREVGYLFEELKLKAEKAEKKEQEKRRRRESEGDVLNPKPPGQAGQMLLLPDGADKPYTSLASIGKLPASPQLDKRGSGCPGSGRPAGPGSARPSGLSSARPSGLSAFQRHFTISLAGNAVTEDVKELARRASEDEDESPLQSLQTSPRASAEYVQGALGGIRRRDSFCSYRSMSVRSERSRKSSNPAGTRGQKFHDKAMALSARGPKTASFQTDKVWRINRLNDDKTKEVLDVSARERIRAQTREFLRSAPSQFALPDEQWSPPTTAGTLREGMKSDTMPEMPKDDDQADDSDGTDPGTQASVQAESQRRSQQPRASVAQLAKGMNLGMVAMMAHVRRASMMPPADNSSPVAAPASPGNNAPGAVHLPPVTGATPRGAPPMDERSLRSDLQSLAESYRLKSGAHWSNPRSLQLQQLQKQDKIDKFRLVSHRDSNTARGQMQLRDMESKFKEDKGHRLAETHLVREEERLRHARAAAVPTDRSPSARRTSYADVSPTSPIRVAMRKASMATTSPHRSSTTSPRRGSAATGHSQMSGQSEEAEDTFDVLGPSLSGSEEATRPGSRKQESRHTIAAPSQPGQGRRRLTLTGVHYQNILREDCVIRSPTAGPLKISDWHQIADLSFPPAM